MWLEYYRIARKVLVAHRVRSLLTVLSITVGAYSIVLTSSLAASGLATLSADTEELGGARLIYIWPKPPEREESKQVSYAHGLTRDDRDALLARLPHVVAHTMFATLNRKDVVADNGRPTQSDLVGVDAAFFAALRMQPVRGHFFNAYDGQHHAKVCVVGAKLARELWKGDAVGHTLTIGGLRCRVVAQVGAKEYFGMNYGFDWLDFVAAPLESAGDAEPAIKDNVVLEVKVDEAANNGVVKRIANALLLDRHNGQDDFQIFDFGGVMKKFQSLFTMMEVIVGFIAGIALLVGGIGVMNMMLVSVSERVREIGIRKAIGAGPRDISRQFMLESLVLAGSGGLLGVLGGVGTSQLAAIVIRHFKPSWIGMVTNGAVVAALGVSLGVGLLFGWFPARRAARQDAIAAIRRL